MRPVGDVALAFLITSGSNDRTVRFQACGMIESSTHSDYIRPVGYIALAARVITGGNNCAVRFKTHDMPAAEFHVRNVLPFADLMLA